MSNLPRIGLWLALALALFGTIGNTAWAFGTVDSGEQWMSYVKAIALDVGMVALAATLAQRKRAGQSSRLLWLTVGGFVVGSMYANYLHGQEHLVPLTANLESWRPVILSALLPVMLFALVEIVSHAPTAAVATDNPPLDTAPDVPLPAIDTPTLSMAEVDATSRRLLAVLADAPAGLSKRKAAELAGVNPETARQRIAKLEAAGLVTVNGVVKTANGAHATP
jgi:hypothetical protein